MSEYNDNEHPAVSQDPYFHLRKQMVRTIEMEVRETQDYTGKSSLNKKLLDALNTVPRHEFVSEDMRFMAYDNTPLYIGSGQTISQPYIVAIMTALIEPQENHIVLDIGTGSGYQAAILSRLVKQVYSVEIIEKLAGQAQQRFAQLDYSNIQVKVADGNLGWLEHAPYDGIVVAATAPYIPTALVEQLKPGGKLILPLGRSSMGQELVLIEKNLDCSITTTDVLPVSFVPLVSSFEDVPIN